MVIINYIRKYHLIFPKSGSAMNFCTNPCPMPAPTQLKVSPITADQNVSLLNGDISKLFTKQNQFIVMQATYYYLGLLQVKSSVISGDFEDVV